MSSEGKEQLRILQGTLDLIVLRILAAMGPQQAYGIATRLQQVSEDSLNLNQGTLYPALVRLEQQGWIAGAWSKTENNREAPYYSITRAVCRIVKTPASDYQVSNASSIELMRDSQTPQERLLAFRSNLFGALGTVLALDGIYGLI